MYAASSRFDALAEPAPIAFDPGWAAASQRDAWSRFERLHGEFVRFGWLRVEANRQTMLELLRARGADEALAIWSRWLEAATSHYAEEAIRGANVFLQGDGGIALCGVLGPRRRG